MDYPNGGELNASVRIAQDGHNSKPVHVVANAAVVNAG